MAEITIGHAGPAPAEKPAAPNEVIDASGRRLVLRELSLLEEVDLYSAVGSQDVDNKGVMSVALLVSRVVSIDGSPVKVPTTGGELRALIKRVGREGVTAIQKAMAPPGKAKDGAEPADDEEVALAKN